ncbi:HIG1 domain family member 2A-like [Mercenaria mercenaria]|uniref:HIG1 domain family member 2A-like n=1 Tax=Mercenaria mercenaria TaxID=6596 RepID=UPI001E1E17DE|nr:HIG1 domain family member 2A-like [Mercenaria mercenaria]
MDKNNSSAVQQEEKLMYLSPPKEESFRPTMFETKRDREIQEKGAFRALFLPSVMENPFVLLGLGMTVGALGFGLYYNVKGQRQKSQSMLQYRVIFQGLTIVAIAGGYYYRDYKRRNREALKDLESLKSTE